MSYPSDSMDATPEIALREGLADIERYRSEERGEPSKCLVLFLWDDDGRYDTRFINAGMKTSEMIALMEIVKQRTHKIMEDVAAAAEEDDDDAEGE